MASTLLALIENSRRSMQWTKDRRWYIRFLFNTRYPGIQWKFIPERAPHFGRLWEAAVKSVKFHFKRVVGDTKLNFEELMTVLTQIESCLNSRPLTPLLIHDDDGIEALTPGHFLIGQALESIPDSYRSFSLLKQWDLCQSIVRHFWKRWSNKYLVSLRWSNKWLHLSRNFQVNDIAILQDENLFPSKWPLAKVLQVHPGKDGIIRVASVKTGTGVYKRPVSKLVLLLPQDTQGLWRLDFEDRRSWPAVC